MFEEDLDRVNCLATKMEKYNWLPRKYKEELPIRADK